MNFPFYNLTATRKLENAIVVSILLFILKIIFPNLDGFLKLIVNEIFILTTLYFWGIYLIDFVETRIVSPLSIILNSGILGALLFFTIQLSTAIFDNSIQPATSAEFIYLLFSTFITFVFIGSLIYILITFRELFYLRQKRDPSLYFRTMLVFFVLSALASSLLRNKTDLDFIGMAFYIVSIVLISVNSLRVAWIAFLTKKQKIYLLVLSVVLSTLFAINFALSFDLDLINQILINFSPALHIFFRLLMIYGVIYFGVIFFTALFHLPTAEAYDRKAEELSSYKDLSKLITQVFDFKELADTITSVTRKVVDSDSAWLVIQNLDEFELSSINNIGYVEAEKITSSIIKEAKTDPDEVLIINTNSKPGNLWNLSESGFKSIAVAPMKLHNKTNGFLFSARKHEMKFDEDDKKTVSAFADYASVALENAKLLEESIEKERLEKELDVAREIQYKILPSVTPKCKNLFISSVFVPAFEVGGDYYDYFDLGNNKMGFVIADVSGKGISAAFIMAEVKGIFTSLSKLITSPRELLILANEILKGSLEKKSFVTALYGVIDTNKGNLTFARAGHTPLLHFENGKINRITPRGMGLGLDYGEKFSSNIKEMEIKLNNDDILILYTDGITESQNLDLEEFGMDRFENIILKNSDLKLDNISKKVLSEISLFSRDTSQHDDITLVIFKWKNN